MGYDYACRATGSWGASDEQQAALAACFGNALAAELRVATVGRGRAHECWGVHTAPAPRREARIGRPAGVAAAHVRALPATCGCAHAKGVPWPSVFSQVAAAHVSPGVPRGNPEKKPGG